MSAKLMGTITQEVNLPYKEKWPLTILANYYNEKIGEAHPSIETISKKRRLKSEFYNTCLNFTEGTRLDHGEEKTKIWPF